MYGLPSREGQSQAERGEVFLGGCCMPRNPPLSHCRYCGREWAHEPLPAWWPPEDAAAMDPSAHRRATDELMYRLRRARVAVDAFASSGLDAATTAADDYRRQTDSAQRAAPVVPSDCVLIAEALDAAERFCRILDPDRDTTPWTDELFLLTPEDAFIAFRRADHRLHDRRPVDVLNPSSDRLSALRFDDAGPVASVRRGDGSELPAVGPSWTRRLDRFAATVFREGSGHGWARYLWSRLSLPPIETELDVARAGIRLVALGVLRRALLARLAGDVPGDAFSDAANPGVAPFHLGQLAGLEGVGLDHAHRPDGIGADAETEVARELTRVECRRLPPVLLGTVPPLRLFASTWASQFVGARYPLSREGEDEILVRDSDVVNDGAFEWVVDGMPL